MLIKKPVNSKHDIVLSSGRIYGWKLTEKAQIAFVIWTMFGNETLKLWDNRGRREFEDFLKQL